jgi:prefoldin beta subunit
MVEKVSREVEAKYAKYLKLREMLDKIVQEKVVVMKTLDEIDALLEDIKGLSDDTELYKLNGYVLVKTTKESLVKELEEKKETLETKYKALESQEKKLADDVNRLAEEIKSLLERGKGAAPVGGL